MLSKYNILNPNNYVALSNTSTATPIHTLQHIIEDVQTNNKELWLLSQDMSKAYDSVHLPLLAKALQRIKVPNTIINLLNNILTQRQNNIITNHDNTNYYHVQDGIDQSETITLLL